MFVTKKAEKLISASIKKKDVCFNTLFQYRSIYISMITCLLSPSTRFCIQICAKQLSHKVYL